MRNHAPAARTAGAPPHVLFVTQEYAPESSAGGIATFIRALAHALSAEGCLVTVINCRANDAPAASADGEITVHSVVTDRGWRAVNFLTRFAPQTVTRLRLAWANARAARRLGLRPDVVEAPDWYAEGLLMKRAARAPLVVHLHLAMQMARRRRGQPLLPDERLAAMLERIAARRADAVTAGARAANEVTNGRHWHEPERIRVLPVPVDPDLLSRPPVAWPRERLLVCCGRLDRLKAPELLVDAVAGLIGDMTGLRIVFIGEADRRDAPMYGDYGTWVAARARDLRVPVEFTGRLPWEESIAHLRRANVVVVPSRYESFSMVAVEAMACATPVVVTSACGIAEHLELLGHGWVVPPDDPDALGEALRPLLENPDYARSRGEEALSFARAYFSPRAAAQARIALYRELMRPRIG